MHSKRALIRTITRFLYAGGLIFLIVGMLLSALSTSVRAAGGPPLGALQDATQTISVEQAAAGTATFAAGATQTANCTLCRTVTPKVTMPANPTATGTPLPGQPTNTAAPTRAPMVLNLSNICGYPSDAHTQWKVANPNNTDITYIWRVVGSDDSGSGTVRANSDDYFTTVYGVTVRLYVGDELVDTEACLAPCKQELRLAYTCTESGLIWTATNPNDFAVSYTVRVDNQETGRGAIPAGSTVNVASTTIGAHTVDLTWTDTRPGSHTVRLVSSPDSCNNPTVTPTLTETPLFQEFTFTPTTPPDTSTFTPTPTFTPTTPVDITATFTPTPTVTQTSLPDVIPSFTPTPTVTWTATTGPSPTFTATPTVTLTSLPDVIPSFTPTPTVTIAPSLTFTATPTVTLTSLPNVIPSFTATPTVTLVPTNTPTTTLTALPGFVPSSTPIGTLAPPASTVTSTPVLIPVTGVDLALPIGANSLSIFGSLLTNIGLFTIGLALALTGIGTQIKK